MTCDASYEKVGYRLEYLQSLHYELEKKAHESKLNIQWMINRLCTFLVESDFSKLEKDYSVNEKWIQLLSVYHNLLRRGIPTYPTAQIEEFLLSEVSRVISIEESKNEQVIAFRDKLSGVMKEEWLKSLVKAHATIDYRCDKSHGNYDSEEEEEFLKYLSEKVGASVFQIIECQRPFSTMIGVSDIGEFQDQRVDFSLETNDKRIVVEIDGEQHQEEKQLRLDRQREEILKKNNWDVRRIPAGKVRRKQIDEKLEVLKKEFSDDPFLREVKENFDRPINVNEFGQAALLLVITPILIARIQWVLNWALMKGKLDIDLKTVKIAIVEEDIPCAFLAVWDFIKAISHLKSLAKIESSLPKIELEIIRSNCFDTFSDGIGSVPDDPCLSVHVSRIDTISDTLQNHFDLVIDASSLHIGTKSPRFGFGYNNWITISSVFSPRGANPRFDSAAPINYHIHKNNIEKLQFFLRWIFRKKEFFKGQLEILERSLANKDVIGLLPTGGGKSLCYQLSAMLQPGMTLIVDPIISLMHDQVDGLKHLQIGAIAYLSGDQKELEKKESIDKMANYFLMMLFISPERLQIHDFREKLMNLCVHTPVPYIVIDETHCVSEWGHDFRPSYLRLADNARKLCLHHGFKPTVIGLTGTASEIVLSDIQREINVDEDEAIIRPQTFDRVELEYEVVHCDSSEKIFKIKMKMLELPQRFKMSKNAFFTNENAGIIFCPHVGGKHGIVTVASEIKKEMPDLIKEAGMYGGTPPKNYDAQRWKQNKIEFQNAFKENKSQLMVATKAFGMGIDKPNVRYTIHYNIPTSLEAFYQEAGRAGRDKKPAICIIIFSGEPSYWKKMNTADISVEELKEIDRKSYNNRDDISRLLWLHDKTWQGIESEVDILMELVNERVIPAIQKLEWDERSKILVAFEPESGGVDRSSNKTEKEDNDDRNRNMTERALYRLSLLGLISDYTLDYHARQFEVEVVNRSDEFLKERLLDYFTRYKPAEYRNEAFQKIELSKGQTILEKCIRVMLDFIYEEIEKKRRRAIFQMAEVAYTSQADEPFRAQLLNYLEKSEFTQLLADAAKRITPMEWAEIAAKVEDIDSARHLLGGCRRVLESYPDHPGLLLLSAFSRLNIPTLQGDIAIGEFQRAVELLARSPENVDTRKALTSFLEMIRQKRPPLADNFCYIVLEGFPQREMARTALKYTDAASQSGMLALKILLGYTLEKTNQVRAHILGGEPN
jgi:ATP-dependent DNA helicase RecQ